MLLILRINVRIDEVLDILLSRAEPQERETFARMDPAGTEEFGLSVVLCECLKILDDYLNRSGDFSRWASLRALLSREGGPSRQFSRLNSLKQSLGNAGLEQPSRSARGAEWVTVPLKASRANASSPVRIQPRNPG